MALLRVTAFNNKLWAITPSDVLTVETCSVADRKKLIADHPGSDPKTVVRLLLSGQVQCLHVRNPAQRLADKLEQMKVAKWLRLSRGGGGLVFVRPSAVKTIQELSDEELAAPTNEGSQAIVAAMVQGQTIAWGVASTADTTLRNYEDALQKEQGRSAPEDDEDEVGGLDEDDDAHLDDDEGVNLVVR